MVKFPLKLKFSEIVSIQVLKFKDMYGKSIVNKEHPHLLHKKLENYLAKSNNDILKHDFLNSIVIISNLAKSAKSFSERVAKLRFSEEDAITVHQIELFQKSMEAIRNEAAKIEIIFKKALSEKVFNPDNELSDDIA